MIDDDLNWYYEHVVVRGRPPRLGPARRWQQAWRDVADSVADGSAAYQLALRQGFVLTHEQARALGFTIADLRRLVRRGTWTAPRRGVLSVLPRADDPQVPHGMRPEICAAATALVQPGSTVSHDSAAMMYGLPVSLPPRRPVITMTSLFGRGEPNMLAHAAEIRPDEITTWFGTPVTTVARTVVDIARNSGARAGLITADAALRESLTDPSALTASVARATRWPGVRTARRIVELASPLAESPLESMARLLIVDGKLPVPELQVRIRTSRGICRVDGLWRDRAVVLEVDGMLKYKEPGDLHDEKRRQEALEQAGYLVVRVTWDDVVKRPYETLARIAAALRRGGPRARSAV